MMWAIVCLVASTVAEKTGPDAFGIYLTALSVAAAALAHILFPKRIRRPPTKQFKDGGREVCSAHDRPRTPKCAG